MIFEVPSITNSKNVMGQILKIVSRDPDRVIPRLALNIFYLCTKFGESCLSHSGDMIVGIETENGSCDSDHAPFCRVVCHSYSVSLDLI